MLVKIDYKDGDVDFLEASTVLVRNGVVTIQAQNTGKSADYPAREVNIYINGILLEDA